MLRFNTSQAGYKLYNRPMPSTTPSSFNTSQAGYKLSILERQNIMHLIKIVSIPHRLDTNVDDFEELLVFTEFQYLIGWIQTISEQQILYQNLSFNTSQAGYKLSTLLGNFFLIRVSIPHRLDTNFDSFSKCKLRCSVSIPHRLDTNIYQVQSVNYIILSFNTSQAGYKLQPMGQGIGIPMQFQYLIGWIQTCTYT